MKSRCNKNTPNNPKYKSYAGRGIDICNEWRNDFMAFYNWAINNGFKEGLSIDRIDVNGNYCPENCRWADSKIQANNTTRNHYVTYNGETLTISEWADKFNVSYELLEHRLWSGMDEEQRVFIIGQKKRIFQKVLFIKD